MPNATYCNSSVVLDDSMFITGLNFNSAYIYNILNDTYLSIGSFQTGIHKVLCKASRKLYVFENNKLHESSADNPGEFCVISFSTGVTNSYLISCTTRFRKDLYFVLFDKKIYKLNLTTKIVSLLRSVTK